MAPEKLTGKSAQIEWATFEERDAMFESMRQKAVKLIDPIDFIAIGNQTDLLNKILSPDELKTGDLSPLVKSVIKGLFNDPEARDYLFPEDVQSDSDLVRFIEEAIGGKNDTARNFMDFVLLAVRSGITLIAEANLYRDHIKKKLSSYVPKLFKTWERILNSETDKLTSAEKKERAGLLGFVKGTRSLNSEIFNKVANGTSMDIFCFYLRRLGVENAGQEVEKIMKELLDTQLKDAGAGFMNFLNQCRTETFKKVDDGRRQTKKGIGEMFNGGYSENTGEITVVDTEKIPEVQKKEYRSVLPPTTYFARTGETVNVTDRAPDRVVEDPEHYVSVPVPKPAESAIDAEIKLDEIAIPELASISINEGEVVEEEAPKKRTEKLNSRIADHPKAVRNVILTLTLAVVGGSLYVSKVFSNDKSGKKEGVALKNNNVSVEPVMSSVPSEVMQADKDLATPKEPVRTEPVRSKPVEPVRTESVDSKSVGELREGVYKDMWQGKSFDIQDAPFASISGFMEKKLKGEAMRLESKKDRIAAFKAYNSELQELEKGWLLYMSIKGKELVDKSLKEKLTQEENERLNNWEDYKKNHRARSWQAKRLYDNYLKLKESNKKQLAYYEDLLKRGSELMDGLTELNPKLVDPNNVPKGQEVRFSDGKKVLKTFWRFADKMKLPMPKNGIGTTGELEVPQQVMYAENNVSSPTPPPIPEDAKVHSVDDSDIISVENLQPTYGMGGSYELKPILAEMMEKRKKTPPPIPRDARVHEPKYELKPILADMIKKSQNEAYAEYTVENTEGEYDTYSVSHPKSAISEIDIPRGEGSVVVPAYEEIKVENRPVRQSPPPIPSMPSASVAAKKPGIFERVKGWFKKAA